MGADLCISTLSVKNTNTTSEHWAFFVSELEKVKENILNSNINRNEWEDYYDETGNDTPEEDSEIKEDAIKLVDEAIAGVKGKRRDAVLLNYPERTILLSGGMSWGDMPTDLCDTLYKIGYFPKECFENTQIE